MSAPTGKPAQDVAEPEGNRGTKPLPFTASPDSPAPAGGLTFDASTASG